MTPATASIETRQRRLCSVIAREQGTDPIGSAWGVRRMLALELPLPWPEDYFEARAFPAGLGDTLVALWDRHLDTGMVALAPDKAYSREGWTRVLDFTFPEPPRAKAAAAEYLLPQERLGEFLPLLFDGDPAALTVPEVEQAAYAGRDLFVCTHGTVDACCALFGYPLYRDLRRFAEASGACRVWRSSHFGGHRFAPTLIDFPEGRCWGFLSPEQGEALIGRRGEAAALRELYRGWQGYEEPQAQVLEREALMREGWPWTSWPQRRDVLEQDERGTMLLQITAFPPDGAPIAYECLVEIQAMETVLHSTDGELEETPVYKVRDLRRIVLNGSVVPRDDTSSVDRAS